MALELPNRIENGSGGENAWPDDSARSQNRGRTAAVAMQFATDLQGIRTAGREGGWVLAGQALSAGGSIFALKILTVFLGKSGHGELALCMTVAGAISMFIFAPPRNAADRYLWACREGKTFDSYLLVLRRWHFGAFAVTILLGTLGSALALAMGGLRWGLLILVTSIFAAIGGLSAALVSFHDALRNRRVAAIYQAAGSWGRALLASLLLMLFSRTAVYALAGYLGAECLVTLLLWRRTWSEKWFADAWCGQPGPIEWRPLASSMMNYSAPFLVWSLLAATGIYADRWVVLGVLGSANMGAYAALSQIASSPVQVLVGVVNQWLNAIIFHRAGALRHHSQLAGSLRLVRLSVAATLTIGASVALVTLNFGYRITALLTSASFAPEGRILWVFVVGTTLFLVGQNMVTVGMIHWSNWRYVPAFLVEGLSIIFLTYVLGGRWGLGGAAAGFCAGNGLYAVSVGVANRGLSSLRVEGAVEGV
jgi:O-antigen/teichoic acid export membrane protein